jgi:hypothetical protein
MMRPRPIPLLRSLRLALALAGGTGCGPLGRVEDPPVPPTVIHAVFLDQNRGTNPDLLNDPPPRACSFADPCPPPVRCGSLYFYGGSSGISMDFDVPDPPSGDICHDPESIREVPPSVDAVLRVGFQKPLDTSIADSTGNVAPSILTVRPRGGAPVAGSLIYDPSGSPSVTSDPNLLPYGPALVFSPDQPLAPGTEYEIQLDAARIRARSGGQPLAGPASFTFTTEALAVLRAIDCPAVSIGACLRGDVLQFPDAGADPIGPNQALEYQFNAHITLASLPLIEVRDASGAPVSIAVIPHVDDAAAECPVSSTRVVNVYPTDPITGSATRWTPGSYQLVIPGGPGGPGGSTGVQAADGGARLPATTTVDFAVGAADAPTGAPFLTSDLVTCP